MKSLLMVVPSERYPKAKSMDSVWMEIPTLSSWNAWWQRRCDHGDIRQRLPLWICKFPGGFWFRAYGWGLQGKDLHKHGLNFSERNGYKKYWKIGHWSFSLLSPNN